VSAFKQNYLAKQSTVKSTTGFKVPVDHCVTVLFLNIITWPSKVKVGLQKRVVSELQGKMSKRKQDEADVTISSSLKKKTMAQLLSIKEEHESKRNLYDTISAFLVDRDSSTFPVDNLHLPSKEDVLVELTRLTEHHELLVKTHRRLFDIISTQPVHDVDDEEEEERREAEWVPTGTITWVIKKGYIREVQK
jgi:hypothetical protein